MAFVNIGKDENGNVIANCATCGTNGVLKKKHKCRVKENNKLIAEFMGYEYTESPTCGIFGGNRFTKFPKEDNEPPFEVYHGWHTPNYHKSWNDLMEVIDKIEELGYRTEIHSNSTLIFDSDTIINKPFGYGEQNNRLHCTYKAVVEFIEWYNKQEVK